MAAKALDSLQVLDCSSIDELWMMSSPVPRSRFPEGGDNSKEDFFHNTQESIPELCFSQSDQRSEGCELAPFSSEGENPESSFSFPFNRQKPTSNEVNEERAATECRPELDAWEPILCVQQPSSSVKLHINELLNEKQSQGVFTHLGCVPIHLKFEDIRYKILSRTNGCKACWDLGRCWSRRQRRKQRVPEKLILSGVSGSVAPGEILAMMGPSGSGKVLAIPTTMLNILGGRLLHEKLIGKISYNGLPYSSALKRRIGFVTQDDILFPLLTVRETLVFAALLRLSKTMSHNEKIERAQTVLRELGLERCQNTVVGGAFVPGVSGGERKRTSIGYEILVDPSILLLDEPTSGLDSSTALRILQLLRTNAQMGRVIITTIHQPSSRMFPIFDKLILLSEGHPMYFGAAKDAMHYFESLQFVPQLPMNPFDFLLDLASGITGDITLPPELSSDITSTASSTRRENGSHHIPESQNSVAFTEQISAEGLSADEYQRQMVLKFLRGKYKSNLEPGEKEKLLFREDLTPEQMVAIKTKKQWCSSWWEQLIILCWRNCKERRRDYFNVLRLSQGIVVAFLLGMLWWQTKLNTELAIRDQIGLLFYMVIFWCTFSMWSTLNIFPLEKNYLAKERAADMYRLSAYYMSSTLCGVVAELIHPTIFVSVVYFMTGLKSDFLTFTLTLLSVCLIAITAQAFGEFFGAATLDIKRVGIVSSLTMLIFLLAGGYYVQNIPVFLRWIRYVSIVFYGFNLLQRVQYSPDQTYNCQEIGGCISLDESPIFARINLDGGMRDVLALISMAVGYKFLAYLCLRRV